MDNGIRKIQDDLIFQAGQIAKKLRLNKSMGQLYAALYFSDGPVSLDDLAKICRMSKGNASINIRHLERWNAVLKAYGNGDRRDYYEANNDFIGFSISRGMEIFSDILNKGGAALNGLDEKLDTIDQESMSEEQRTKIEGYKIKLSEMNGKVTGLKKLAKNMDSFEDIIKGLL